MTWQAKTQCLLSAIARTIFQLICKNVNIEKTSIKATTYRASNDRIKVKEKTIVNYLFFYLFGCVKLKSC